LERITQGCDSWSGVGSHGAGHFGLGAGRAGCTFKSSVDLVSMAAIVRDGRGKIVQSLRREDFEVYDSGKTRRSSTSAPSRGPRQRGAAWTVRAA
jgi:hypothetical protein